PPPPGRAPRRRARRRSSRAAHIHGGFSVGASVFLSISHELTRYIVTYRTRRARPPGSRPPRLPGEADRAPARALALVEAMGIRAGLAAVELEVGSAALPGPI